MTPLRIPEELAARIRAHGAETYPNECCGALLGHESDSERFVADLFPLPNRHNDSPHNRFVVNAEDVRQAEKIAREKGLELLGWYHSHPDHPARPSEYDREHAWPWYSYVIVGVGRGEPKQISSWRLTDDRTRFDVEVIEFVPQEHAAARR